MYYDIGDFRALNSKELIGVFDIDATTVSKKTRDYLNLCEKQGILENISHENIPLSFVVSKKRTYFSPISAKTIYLRTIRHD